jgi:hypothetical protein
VVTVLAGLASGLVVVDRPADSATRVPAQLVAKLYSEALGRMPDPGGWAHFLSVFRDHGCGTTTVRDAVRSFYTSAEFLKRPYGATHRVLALYRGALNREPDQAGLDHWTGELTTRRMTWDKVVGLVVDGGEFASLTRDICGGPAGYHYGTAPAPDLPVTGPGFTGTAEQLQAALNSTPVGGTVQLAKNAVVRLDRTLVIPAGRTLATVGNPGPDSYALQGRLVRTGTFGAASVRLDGGARLLNVWVDGQRGAHTNYVQDAINVQVLGGTGSAVSGSKISNSRGWTSLLVNGATDGHPCGAVTVSGNLVTAYSSEHMPDGTTGRWTDGISVSCEAATVTNNGIVDATDVGIVIFKAYPVRQASTVSGNTILSAGNSAYGAIAIDGLHGLPARPDFTGTKVTGNAFWTGPNTHYDIGLAVGTRPWFGGRSSGGEGATVTGNTTNGLTATVSTGIAVSGMTGATVRGNDLRLSIVSTGRCPQVAFGVDPADGGGAFEPPATSVGFADCIGHI